MKKLKYRFTIFVLFFALISQAQTTTLKTGEWLNNWYLAGPIPLGESTDENRHLPEFEHDFLHENGGEANLHIKEGQSVNYDGGAVQWTKYEGSDAYIDLDNLISKKSYVMAYAYTEVESETEGIYLLSVGTNDGGRLWFNGEQVWDCAEARGFTPDDDLVPVFVRKGKNKILLKVEELGNSWGFGMRFLDLNINEFVSQQSLFRVVVNTEGIPEFRFSQKKSVINKLFDSVQLKVTDEFRENTIWQGNWSQESGMVLPVSGTDFQKNLLVINATFSNGGLWNKEIPFSSGKPKFHSLFENGETDYFITISKDASESEEWAAKELQHWLKEISGASFPIKTDDEEIGANELIIGYNKHALAVLGNETKISAETDESYHYKNKGSKILLLGGKQRGAMYAVFSFLENELGCRWYTPTVNIIPSKAKFNFNYFNHTESPSIRVRNDFYYEAFDPTWAARNKINGAMGYRTQHGDVEGYWSVHTFFPLMPPTEFFETHPEYYSLIDGVRTHEQTQLCLTNPDVLDIITDRLRKTMREKSEYLIYSVSQNDWRNPCQCDKCQAIAEKEKSEAGPLIWFVNQVAERIKDEFPDKYVGTLAYQYTRKPPANIKPLENVVVRFCSIECCFAHDFKSCPENKDFLDDLEGWAAIAPHMYIWDYVVNFSHYIMPYPNFNVLKSNIKTFKENNAIGIMEQAAYQSRGGEFSELRAYLISKLLWNDDVDVDLVINDFMSGYYGRSGQYIRMYLDLLHDQLTENTHIHLGLRADDILFSDEFIRKAEHIFNQAEQVADNDEILRRVEMARLPIMYLKCKRNPVEAKYDGTYERFNQIVKQEGITHFAESGKPHIESFHRQVKSAE